ncbi:hypothetical protein Ahy_A04g020173 [Arachis hypogaea]|uniref:Protein FAR1-RELATED SEQUENCE n=1 Tax=Arachis hypogaea TaxID=3818 RepID=A0A445DHB9_ARAHY|nr:hypothetical protein Ahy_A04g020173 [Arachis hypogaea]
MNNINYEPISTSTNHESATSDPEDGLLNEETLFDMSILGDEAGFPNMTQTDIEPQSAQVPSHVSVEDVLMMEFFTPGEAREFYTSYSRLKGFAIRKSKRAPKAVITDGDPSMRLAIMHVFPYAHHILCAWNLLRNATAHVSQPRFTQLFKQCMLADIEVDELEIQWEAMVDECVDFLREKEEELDFHSFYGTPVLQIQFPEIERMESYGIPCVHIIVVLVGIDIGSLPETLVLKRWCKNAKNNVTFVRQVTEMGDAASWYCSRLGAFVDQCKHFAKVACLRDEDYKVFSEKMARDAIMLEVKNGLHVALDVNPHLNGEGMGGHDIFQTLNDH